MSINDQHTPMHLLTYLHLLFRSSCSRSRSSMHVWTDYIFHLQSQIDRGPFKLKYHSQFSMFGRPRLFDRSVVCLECWVQLNSLEICDCIILKIACQKLTDIYNNGQNSNQFVPLSERFRINIDYSRAQ